MDAKSVFDRISQYGLNIEDSELLQLHTEAVRHFDAYAEYRANNETRKAEYELELTNQALERYDTAKELDKTRRS